MNQYTATTRFHMLLDRGLEVPDSLFVLIGHEQGITAELAAREWYKYTKKSRPQD